MDEPAQDFEVVDAHRDVVEPLWTEPLWEGIESDVSLPDGGTFLVAESRCGYLPLHLIGVLPEGVRLIALEPTRAMLDEARERVAEEASGRVFFVAESVDSISYADGVFNAAICLHGSPVVEQLHRELKELNRVTDDGGEVMCASPLRSSFPEMYDLLDEALRAEDLEERVEELEGVEKALVGPADMVAGAEKAGLRDVELSEVSWQVQFERGRELLNSPLLRETFLPHWMEVVPAPDREAVMGRIADAIDTYWSVSNLRCDLRAGFLTGRARG